MAAQAATINVTFTSQYSGLHRVCYRPVGTVPYTCFTVLCSGFSTPCSYPIPITVDNETCDEVEYEGYVQAACEEESSETGRIPFEISFVPNPTCLRLEATCVGVPINNVTITNGGTGYDGSQVGTLIPVLTSTGSGAVIEITAIDGGAIIGVAVTATGGGYTTGDSLNVPAPLGEGTAATIDIVFGTCSDFTYTGCDEETHTKLSKSDGIYLELGETTVICTTNEDPVLTSVGDGEVMQITDNLGNCICECTSYSITAGETDPLSFEYIPCGAETRVKVTLDPEGVSTFCAVTGSVNIDNTDPVDYFFGALGEC
jgi:hypothetical protein